ncbi:uncharacterized protein LOC117932345 isoform X2 [Vitis riparia]|uniref:uncharacterized protein LOC117932345 isoform X2 n=1 Tax=Vitis riparia TaxID=96939 RepID=UPI00155A8B43|nr:uncharacterized protein LOC117932345 isoform X2 [Vitis riparia]
MQAITCHQVQYLVTEDVPGEIVNEEREVDMLKEGLIERFAFGVSRAATFSLDPKQLGIRSCDVYCCKGFFIGEEEVCENTPFILPLMIGASSKSCIHADNNGNFSSSPTVRLTISSNMLIKLASQPKARSRNLIISPPKDFFPFNFSSKNFRVSIAFSWRYS